MDEVAANTTHMFTSSCVLQTGTKKNSGSDCYQHLNSRVKQTFSSPAHSSFFPSVCVWYGGREERERERVPQQQTVRAMIERSRSRSHWLLLRNRHRQPFSISLSLSPQHGTHIHCKKVSSSFLTAQRKREREREPEVFPVRSFFPFLFTAEGRRSQ